MRKIREIKNLKGTMINVLLAVGFLSLASCAARDDVSFARQVMTGLVAGRYMVRPWIDWPNLVVLDKDVGAEYNHLANAQDKMDYERAFIDSFGKGFQNTKATMKIFNSWRLLKSKDPAVTTVAAGCLDKTRVFLFEIRHTNRGMKLIKIVVLQITDPEKFNAYEKGEVDATL